MWSENFEGHKVPMESRKDVAGAAGQRFAQGPSNLTNASARLREFSATGGIGPILNYSSQTGEEFSLEFMRERAISKKHMAPSTSADQNIGTGYMGLRGTLGASQTGSESGKDAPSLTNASNQASKEIEKKSVSESENKGRYTSARLAPRAFSSDVSNRGGSQVYTSSEASDISAKKMKFLCSFGGKILPRPKDGKLRYVGGDTRILRISWDISWQELMQKTTGIYNQPHMIKYQLPGEDLDALISVSCDEDLRNMMEECSVLEGGEGSQKLRMFLFSSSDFDDINFSMGSMEGDSEVQYVVAVNGMDVGAAKTSSGHGLASTSASDLDQLLNLNSDSDRANISREATDLAGIPPASLMPPTIISTQIQTNSSSDYDTHFQSYQGHGMEYLEGAHYAYTAIRPPDRFYNINNRDSVPLSIPSDYGYSSQYTPNIGSSVAMPPYDLSFNQGAPEGLSRSKQVHEQDTLLKEEKQPINSMPSEKNRMEHIQSLENFNAPMHHHDASVSNHMHTEVSSIASAQEDLASLLPLNVNGKHLEAAQVSMGTNTVPAGQGCEFSEDDRYSSGGALTSGFSDYEADMTDHSYNDTPCPARVYHSEMIPREQPEFLNRLSKSDDSLGSQFLILHSRSDVAKEPIAEAVDPALEGLPASQIEKTSIAEKTSNLSPPAIVDGSRQFSGYKELAEMGIQMNQYETTSSPEGSDTLKFPCSPALIKEQADTSDDRRHKIELKMPKAELNSAPLTTIVGQTIDEDRISDETSTGTRHIQKNIVGETDMAKSKLKEPTKDVTETGADIKQQEGTAIVLPNISWEEITAKAAYPIDVDHDSDLPWLGSSSIPISQEESLAPNTEKRDILIDINDRFPPDILSDFFSKARIAAEYSSISPLRKDDIGLSVKMQNDEPKRWSFFRNLAQDEFKRKDVSLMDLDHTDYASLLPKMEGTVPRSYQFAGVQNLNQMGPQIDLEEEMQQEPSSTTVQDSNIVHPGYISSQVGHPHLIEKGGAALQGENPLSKVAKNQNEPISEYEELKFEDVEAAGPILDASLADIDLSDLQIIKNEDLEELRELGSGTFGTVYHGKWRGTDVAIKRIKKSCFTGRSSEQERLTLEFWREAEILSKLHHPNVVAFYGVVQDGPGGTLATVTEFMVNGSLRHVLLRKDKYLDRRKRLIIAMDAAFGMEYLHSKNIVHFDLKCDNLLVNLKDQSRPICKVGDFGLSKIKRNTLVSGGVRGTLPWMAPELLNGSSNKVSEKVDVFSFGIVMWEILTGEEPYANMHYGAIIGGIVNNTLRPPVPATCDPEWKRVMEQCWAPDPVQRPSFTQIASKLRSMSVASQSKSAK
ncbi:uncharacterized protein [Typha angustifolia]|uniref:uncharacterized protein n=1 Tax=Typha angustifolia TaxID=59011 RepID=UPI003C2CFE7D